MFATEPLLDKVLIEWIYIFYSQLKTAYRQQQIKIIKNVVSK